MKTIFILSDAIRYDYVQYMPNMESIANRNYYIERTIPGIGFCEISEYLSGKDSLENGNIFQITFNGKFIKISSGLRRLDKIATFFQKIPKVRTYAYKYVSRTLVKKYNLDPEMVQVRYNIPLFYLPMYEPTESKFDYCSSEFFGKNNIFSVFEEKGITYDIDDFVKHNKIYGSDDDRLERLKKKIEKKELQDFTLLYIGYGEMAHFLGTDNEQFHDLLRSYDEKLKQICDDLQKIYGEDYNFLFMGDHGMVDVKNFIDIESKVIKYCQKEHLIIGEDIAYFVDSTAIRINFKKKDKNEIRKMEKYLIKELEGFMDDITFDFENKKGYGDIILMIKPENMFYPDFFNTRQMKGMHGYTNKIKKQHGVFIAMGGDVVQEHQQKINLKDVKNQILKIMNIE